MTVDGLKNSTRAALFRGAGISAGLITTLYISGLQPAGGVNGPSIPRARRIGTVQGSPAIYHLTTLPQFNNRGFELVQHFPAFQKKFINNFSLF
jgi:hypothetical protein